MRTFAVIAASLTALAFVAMPTEADSRPEFPITLEVEYGLGDGGLYEMEVTLEEDSTYVDSDRDSGTWFYRRSEGTLLLRYGGDAEGYDLYGVRDGSCFEGDVLFEEVAIDRWSGCAIR